MGEKSIESLQVGDEVITRDAQNPNSLNRTSIVLETFVRVAPVISIQVNGQIIETTAEHPFYVEGIGWRCAKELKVGDVLLSHNDQKVIVETVGDGKEVKTVYNVCIAETHTYFVGRLAWGFSVWAHNAEYAVVRTEGGWRLWDLDRNDWANPHTFPDEASLTRFLDDGELPWRQSELDVLASNPGHNPQVSFRNGRQVRYGERGSVRPEGYRLGEAIEVKNYNLLDPRSRAGLYNRIRQQFLRRISNLPRGTHQRIVLDIRGQNVPESIKMRVRRNILSITHSHNVTVEFLE